MTLSRYPLSNATTVQGKIQNVLHGYFESETRRALQGECMAQRKLAEAEMERDRMIWDKRNSDWTTESMKQTDNLNHKRQNHIMKTTGLVKLRWKAEEQLKNWQ